MLEIDYDNSSYRFARPSLWQHSFYSMYKTGVFYEYEILEDMRQRLNVGELVIDVGANIGNHTVFLAGVCRCDVIAFEPHPDTFEDLTKNIALNELNGRVTAIKAAAGAKLGYGLIRFPVTENYGEIAIKEVTARTDIRIEPLDCFDLARPPRLLKIDVEGAEINVLKGAESLIKQSRPLIYLEALDEDAFNDAWEFLRKMNYRVLRFFEPATFMFVSVEDPVFGSQNAEAACQLARLCLRYCSAVRKAKLEVRESKRTWIKVLRARIKGKELKRIDLRRRLDS